MSASESTRRHSSVAARLVNACRIKNDLNLDISVRKEPKTAIKLKHKQSDSSKYCKSFGCTKQVWLLSLMVTGCEQTC